MASLSRRLSNRQILDVDLAAQRFSTARLGVNQTWRSGYGFWVFDLGYSQGLTAFNSLEDADDAPQYVPKAQFNKIDGSANWFWSWSQYRFNNSLRFQYSQDNLYSSEQMHLGDRFTVRGYAESPISGDSGLYSRNEVNAAMPEFMQGNNSFSQRFNFMRWYGFFDYGCVERADSEKNVFISGVGAGIKYSEGLAAVDVSLSHSLYSNDENIDGGWQFYLNASVKLY
jgi:hemolysin activation/secretion protein